MFQEIDYTVVILFSILSLSVSFGERAGKGQAVNIRSVINI